ncbi:MAG: glycosyltransferase [Verrucomicrobia bacterium]|nr:glycosyltransferase [Verrucomicrobiota bacterium]
MKKRFSFAFFGSSLVSAFWNGAATYYRGIIHALYRLGHSITFFEPDALDRQQHRDIADPPWAKVVVYPPTFSGMQAALNQAREANVIVKTSGVGIFDEELEAAVLVLKKPDNVVLFWDVDAPATLDRVLQDEQDPFRQLIPRFDAVMTYGGGEPVIQAYESLGAKLCVPIYNALDPSVHTPVARDESFAADLSFLGNRLPDREVRVDEFFLRAAQLSPRYRFLLGGSGWKDKSLPQNVKYVGHVYTEYHNVFNCSPRAVLNINRASMARYGFSPPTRLFEVAGAAACLITDEWVGLEHFLRPGHEVLVAQNGAEVATILQQLDAGQANRIGQAARARVLAEHTYQHRASLVERTLQELAL